ncbi:conserved hypothetical protein [Flavobacterium sp. 9AF]|uniref:hypothetical protein n=1 Tax=Flavobacterium sp. 9AF TaxID=2653142 RepID=UPI0012F2E500|nr:hypothetical protein [Flavobacterium sp. 9AF]VXB64385.1 conserved hypothetical protein [Flavobacterium sp. 9AF]
MLKKVFNQTGIKVLSNEEKKNINGGLACRPDGSCPRGSYCVTSGTFEGLCRPL